jgi:hypothetical protein
MDFFAGCADETADKNGGAVIILVVAFDDLAVHFNAGLIGKVAFSAKSGNGGRREPVPVAVAQADDQITGMNWVVEILHVHFVDHFVGGIPGALVDAVGGGGRVGAGLPGEQEIGRIQRSRKRQSPQSGKKSQTDLGIHAEMLNHFKPRVTQRRIFIKNITPDIRLTGRMESPV